MKEKITKAEFINTWASEWDEITGWKVSEKYHKQLSEQLEPLINQEVEKRIKERMPSEDDGRDRIPYPDKPTELKHYQNIGFIRGWRAAIKECRSRLSQKTEG